MSSAAKIVISHDLARVVDPIGLRIGRAKRVESSEDAPAKQKPIASANIAVTSHDLTEAVDPQGNCTSRAWTVNRGVVAPTEQKTVAVVPYAFIVAACAGAGAA